MTTEEAGSSAAQPADARPAMAPGDVSAPSGFSAAPPKYAANPAGPAYGVTPGPAGPAYGAPPAYAANPAGPAYAPPVTFPAAPAAGPPAWPAPGTPRTDGMAVASLACSIAGFLIGLLAIVGVVLGFVARTRIRNSQGQRTGAGVALAGIIVGFAAIVASVALAVVLVVLVGRSTSSSTTSAPPSASPPPAPSASATASASPSRDRAADAALAQRQLLPAGAYPSGWTAQGPSSKATGANFFGGLNALETSGLAACVGVDPGTLDPSPIEEADQGYGDDNTGTYVNDTVEVYESSDAAAADVGAAANPKAAGCVQTLQSDQIVRNLAQGNQSGETLGKPTVTGWAVPALGDQATGLQIAVPDSYQGATTTLYVDTLFVRVGRSESVLAFFAPDKPVPLSTVTPLAQAAVHAMSGS